jgi:hypothetical protein
MSVMCSSFLYFEYLDSLVSLFFLFFTGSEYEIGFGKNRINSGN